MRVELRMQRDGTLQYCSVLSGPTRAVFIEVVWVEYLNIPGMKHVPLVPFCRQFHWMMRKSNGTCGWLAHWRYKHCLAWLTKAWSKSTGNGVGIAHMRQDYLLQVQCSLDFEKHIQNYQKIYSLCIGRTRDCARVKKHKSVWGAQKQK